MLKYHSVTADETLKELGSDPATGLGRDHVDAAREKYGYNELPKPRPKPRYILFLEQFNDPIIYILIVAAILNSFAAEAKDGIVIGVVVLLNTFIGFIQEIRAEAAIKSLESLTAPTARVLRGGTQSNIPSAELVPGDIILLESGDRTPADARLISSGNLLIDESMLTGESFAVEKKHGALLGEDAALGDRVNMIYSGTIIQKGRAKAVVTATGASTEFGRISEKVMESESGDSPLQQKMEKFGKSLSITIMSVVALIFIIGIINGNEWITMLLTAVGLAVSAIPEGLPVSVTITLSIGLYQMAKRRAIVKRLSAVETLGSTTVICTDKTGTLTKNQMAVISIFTGGDIYSVEGSGYETKGEVKSGTVKVMYDNNPALETFALISKHCSESHIEAEGDEWKITGDATESALMILAEKLGYGKEWRIETDMPFESELQMMAVRAIGKDGRTFALVKGAPEALLAKSSLQISHTGAAHPVEPKTFLNKASEMSENGLRVLGLAYKEIENEKLDFGSISGLTFVGLAGIRDAIREEVPEAVEECSSAGVKVIMITGDHIQTAKAIARSANIGEGKEEPVAVQGSELEKMSDEELFERITDIDVFARVAPDHKFRIVETLQKHGKIVAMTGDGVNDAPALKKADIGIAMGSGSDVAKEASAMVLMDDNFASIVGAIRRGRVVLKNLQHILLYILATSFGGLLTIAVSVFAGLPLPLLPAQLLWINLVTDGTSTFPLAFEKEHGNPMKEMPRPKESPLVSSRMFIRIFFAGLLMMLGTLGIYTWALEEYATLENAQAKATSLAFCTLALFQIWNVQNSRSYHNSLFFDFRTRLGKRILKIGITNNPILLAVMCLSLLLQIAAVELPFMNDLLKTVPLTWKEWMLVISVSFSIVIFIELTKFISNLIGRERIA